MQLNNHLHENNLTFLHQSAYRSHHSCETALLKIQEDMLCMLEPKSCVIVLFLDFSAAFDTVDHCILLNKLKNQFFVEGLALKWFESFLTNRSCYVSLGDGNSTVRSVKYGVSQGSVL